MTLAGTRPILPDELEQYELHHRARIAIKPGITGMWQVSGRSDITDFEEIVRLDTEYISEWNIGLDIKILFKELFIDRRENSKSLAWSSVLLAFHNIPSIGSVVDRPKALGDIRGVTYIYAMFYRFGLIDAPQKAKEKMEPVRKGNTRQMSFG